MEKRKMKKITVESRKRELNRLFKTLPKNKQALLRTTIETVAFMDVQMKDLEEIIAGGSATTPDKQLYASLAKTRDVLMKKLITELPEEQAKDSLAAFLDA